MGIARAQASVMMAIMLRKHVLVGQPDAAGLYHTAFPRELTGRHSLIDPRLASAWFLDPGAKAFLP
jgi:hypothetical protein